MLSWRFMWRDLKFKSVYQYCYCRKTSWVEYYLYQAQLASSKQTWSRRWFREHTHCSHQNFLWFDASQYAKRTRGAGIRASWPVSRRNMRSLRSFINWLVTTNRRTISLSYKHRILSLKILNPGRAETSKVFQQWTHKMSLLSNCSNHLPTNVNFYLLRSCPKEMMRLLCECIVDLHKGDLLSRKTYHFTKFQKEVWMSL